MDVLYFMSISPIAWNDCLLLKIHDLNFRLGNTIYFQYSYQNNFYEIFYKKSYYLPFKHHHNALISFIII
jgi:hypothetical protein